MNTWKPYPSDVPSDQVEISWYHGRGRNMAKTIYHGFDMLEKQIPEIDWKNLDKHFHLEEITIKVRGGRVVIKF